jgi:hypothetical protein
MLHAGLILWMLWIRCKVLPLLKDQFALERVH